MSRTEEINIIIASLKQKLARHLEMDYIGNTSFIIRTGKELEIYCNELKDLQNKEDNNDYSFSMDA